MALDVQIQVQESSLLSTAFPKSWLRFNEEYILMLLMWKYFGNAIKKWRCLDEEYMTCAIAVQMFWECHREITLFFWEFIKSAKIFAEFPENIFHSAILICVAKNQHFTLFYND